MKRSAALLFTTMLLVGTLFSSNAFAKTEYDPYYDIYPIRLAAYPLHAVGLGLEWAIFRPLHAFVNIPGIRTIVGERVEDGLDRELTSL